MGKLTSRAGINRSPLLISWRAFVISRVEGKPKRREQYGATGLILLAIPLIYSMERKKFEEAGTLIERALEIEPDNAMVVAWAAHWQLIHAGQGWTSDIARTLATAEALCVRAIRIRITRLR